MTEKQHVVIIIPTYNEALSLSKMLAELNQVICTSLTHYTVTLLIFDSNSTDETVAIIKTKQQQVDNLIFITEAKKSGLGAAYCQAMQYALAILKADIIFEFDADGSHQPCYLPGMLKKFEQGADVVVGSRYVKGGQIPKDWGFHRKLLSVAGNLVARTILTSRYHDFTSGYRGTRASLLRQVSLNQLLSKMSRVTV